MIHVMVEEVDGDGLLLIFVLLIFCAVAYRKIMGLQLIKKKKL